VARGLVLTIFGTLRWKPEAVPFTVALYITSAYWFTASTSFANRRRIQAERGRSGAPPGHASVMWCTTPRAIEPMMFSRGKIYDVCAITVLRREPIAGGAV
jgi:hypothetical protein